MVSLGLVNCFILNMCATPWNTKYVADDVDVVIENLSNMHVNLKHKEFIVDFDAVLIDRIFVKFSSIHPIFRISKKCHFLSNYYSICIRENFSIFKIYFIR